MEVTREQSTPNFPKNERYLPPDTHTYVCVSGGKKCSFFRSFGMFCFFVTVNSQITMDSKKRTPPFDKKSFAPSRPWSKAHTTF